MTANHLINYFKRYGYKEIHRKGSHVKLYNPYSGIRLIMPVHDHELSAELENAIYAQTKLYMKRKRGVI